MALEERITAGPIDCLVSPALVKRRSFLLFRQGIPTSENKAQLIIEDFRGKVALVKVPGDYAPQDITFHGQVQRYLNERKAYLAYAHSSSEGISGDLYELKEKL